MRNNWDEKDLEDLISKVVARELQPGSSVPEIDTDLLKTEMVDSMGWVGILSGLEEATGVANFGSSWPEGKPQSIRSLVDAAREALTTPRSESGALPHRRKNEIGPRQASVAGWGYALGSLQIDAANIEAECGLAAGTIRDRAGIRSVRRADQGEDEVILAQRAASLALESADLDASDLDFLVCTSTTFLELPPLSAAVHSRLLLDELCPALDVGGACVGLLNALATTKALLADGSLRAALVVASEVHSRRLASSQVRGEFRGLFGDGACALVLRSSDSLQGPGADAQVGTFVAGCSGSASSSLRVAVHHNGELGVAFNGEALANAAVATLSQVITKLEDQSGVVRSEVEGFAFHEPNPRLMAVVAQRANIPRERIAQTAETSGNLGSVTCGINLCKLLTRHRENPTERGRRVIFVAAVGPGLLWGGTYLVSGG